MKELTTHTLFLILVLMTAFLVSCEKVIDIDLNEAEPRLVVEGAIILNHGPFAVRLTTSGDFFTGEGIGFVSDASVQINGSDGQSEALTNTGNGIYITKNTVANPGIEYTININYNNKVYSGSDTLPEQTNIINLDYSASDLGTGGPNGDEEEYDGHFDVFCNFKDPAEKRNFYMLQIKINGEDVEGRRKYNLLSDENVNGQTVNYPFFGIGANYNDTISIILSAVGPATYDYFRTLNDAVSQGGMGSTPYNPISNINNNALGYFGTFTYDEKSFIVKPLE